MYRNSNYNKDLARELSDPEFAQGFLLDLMEGEEGLSAEIALRTTIQAMGVSEFCKRARLSHSFVDAFLKSKRKPKPETLNDFLKPFGLRAKVVFEKAS